jgi:hypothetical protein
MQLLWTFTCPAVEGLMVTGLSWNHANPDLLAVSYRTPPQQPGAATGAAAGSGGEAGAASGSGGDKARGQEAAGGSGEGAAAGALSGSKLLGAQDVGGKGAVALWSLKNPDYPLWHFTTPTGGSRGGVGGDVGWGGVG